MKIERLVMLLLLGFPGLLRAQDSPPADLSAIELERSRTCVDVLGRLEDLDLELQPVANRVQRLLAIGGAITIEEAAIADSLDTADPLEAAVSDWFRADAELARRYLDEQSQEILDERAAGKQVIRARVEQELTELQARADSIMAPTGDLRSQASSCSGAILVREAAVEACGTDDSRVCQAARDSTVQSPFRFVDSPDFLWYRQEMRPWTAPGPIQVGADGQLGGARTVGNTRVGNVIVSLAFNPLFQSRDGLTEEDLAIVDSINVPLGIDNSHPQLSFVPALAIQATLPRALGGESEYILHFGPPDAPDIIWGAEADTGAPLLGSIALAPEHVAQLVGGDPLTLSAIRETDTGEAEIVYAIELSSLNQVSPVRNLLGYMSEQLAADLTRLIPPPENP